MQEYTLVTRAVFQTSPRSQSHKEMWLTGEKYDWLATWSRHEKAKRLTDDLSQYDWRRRHYDDFSQHRHHLQRSPDPLAVFEGMERGRNAEKENERDGKGRGVWRKERGEKEQGKGKGREKRRERYTPLFGTKWRHCQAVIIREE